MEILSGNISTNISLDQNTLKNIKNSNCTTMPTASNHAQAPIRKIICRYGHGCTHLLDPSHKEKFWHPSIPASSVIHGRDIVSQFVCNECGYIATSIEDLQLHLQRKTAWSNLSLVGCRISCLVDYKEWHEGYVTQLHKSGKHFVEFRLVNEKRWLHMKKISFYIVERPIYKPTGGSTSPGTNGDVSCEFKETNSPRESDGLAPLEDKDNWVFVEDISLDFAFAQSILFKLYGNSIQETGHLTKGHICLTESDRRTAVAVKVSLLYGELLPRGVNKALGLNRLSASNASVLFDLGMGTGKVLIQAFLQFKNLRYVYGVELSVGRYKIAEEALLKMIHLLGAENYQVQMIPGKFIIIRETLASACEENDLEMECFERVLHFECGNMFGVPNIEIADIVMMETDFPAEIYPDLYKLLSSMQEGARILTYLDLRRISKGTGATDESFCELFKQLESNKHLSDRYPTSWSVQRGHHFFLWTKVNYHADSNSSGSHGQSSSTSWGHNFSVGMFMSLQQSHVSSNSNSNGIHSQGSFSTGSPGKVVHNSSSKDRKLPCAADLNSRNSKNNRCLPFGLGSLLPSFFRSKSHSSDVHDDKSSMDNSLNGGKASSPNGARQTTSNSTSTNVMKERTVIPINIDGLRGGDSPTILKIPTGSYKVNHTNYPNYIERAAHVKENFVVSEAYHDRSVDDGSDKDDESDSQSQLSDDHHSSTRDSARDNKERSHYSNSSGISKTHDSPIGVHPSSRSNKSHSSKKLIVSPRENSSGHHSTPRKSRQTSSSSSLSFTPREVILQKSGSQKSSARINHSKSVAGPVDGQECVNSVESSNRMEHSSDESDYSSIFPRDSNCMHKGDSSPSGDDSQAHITNSLRLRMGDDGVGPLPYAKFTPNRPRKSADNRYPDSPCTADGSDDGNDTAQRYYMTHNVHGINPSPSPMGLPAGHIYSPSQLILASYTDQHMQSPISLDEQFINSSSTNNHFSTLHHSSPLDNQDITAPPFATLGLNYMGTNASNANRNCNNNNNNNNATGDSSMDSPNGSRNTALNTGFLLGGVSESTITEVDG